MCFSLLELSILYLLHRASRLLEDPENLSRQERRKMLDYLSELNEEQINMFGDKEIESRISQYEMAYRMQTSVPETMDISDEPENILKMYQSLDKELQNYPYFAIRSDSINKKDLFKLLEKERFVFV